MSKSLPYTATPTRQVGPRQLHLHHEVRETAHADRWGRLIGGRASTWEEHHEVTGEPDRADGRPWHKPAGHLWAFEPHAMRAGKGYGAIQTTQYYASEADRDAAVARYFVNMEKRARKTAEADAAKVAAKAAR